MLQKYNFYYTGNFFFGNLILLLFYILFPVLPSRRSCHRMMCNTVTCYTPISLTSLLPVKYAQRVSVRIKKARSGLPPPHLTTEIQIAIGFIHYTGPRKRPMPATISSASRSSQLKRRKMSLLTSPAPDPSQPEKKYGRRTIVSSCHRHFTDPIKQATK